MGADTFITAEMHQDLVRRFREYHNCTSVDSAARINWANSRLVQSDPFAALLLDFVPFNSSWFSEMGYSFKDLVSAVEWSVCNQPSELSEKINGFLNARERICQYTVGVLQAANAVTEVWIPDTVEHTSLLEPVLYSAVPTLQGGSSPAGTIRNTAWVFLEWRIAWGV